MALILGIRPLSFFPRSPVCFQAGERLPAHCAMAALSEDRRSAMARDFGDRNGAFAVK
jgi:hypothetical protein